MVQSSIVLELNSVLIGVDFNNTPVSQLLILFQGVLARAADPARSMAEGKLLGWIPPACKPQKGRWGFLFSLQLQTTSLTFSFSLKTEQWLSFLPFQYCNLHANLANVSFILPYWMSPNMFSGIVITNKNWPNWNSSGFSSSDRHAKCPVSALLSATPTPILPWSLVDGRMFCIGDTVIITMATSSDMGT